MRYRGGPPLLLYRNSCRFGAHLICPYLCRMEEKAKRSGREQERRPPRQAAAGRQRQAGRHGRGFPRAFPYIAQKGGGRPARRIGSTAGRAAGGTAGGGANWSSIILLFIIIIYTIHS